VTKHGLNILQVNTADFGGGAERVAMNLHRRYLDMGHSATMAVGRISAGNCGNDDTVVQIGNAQARNAWARAWSGLSYQLHTHEHRLGNTRRMRAITDSIARPKAWADAQLGREHFGHPGTSDLLGLTPHRPDLIHLHNLHGDYFDLRELPGLSKRVPVFVTLHDAWMLAGHCAHSLGCDRWQTGCGNCPSLGTYPAVKRDATAGNWQRKQNIYAKTRLYLAAPSKWLLDKAERSMLAPAVLDAKVIPNGVDPRIFHPGNTAEARHRLALPENAYVVLFAANGIRRSDFKDYQSLRDALGLLGQTVNDRPIHCVALGEAGESEQIGRSRIQFVAAQSDPNVVADYYRAADVYAHAAKEDTFPTTVIEAMACGTPVVASDVGGIPEQVDHGQTGMLVPVGDATLFSAYLRMLLRHPGLRHSFGKQASKSANERFNLETQADSLLDWYEQVVHNVRSQGTRIAA